MEKYGIYHGNKKIGTLYRTRTGKFRVEFIDGLDLRNLPVQFYSGYKRGERVFEKQALIMKWIEDRGFDRGRMNINGVMKKLEMKEYDPWVVFKTFKGKNASDFYSVRQEKEKG